MLAINKMIAFATDPYPNCRDDFQQTYYEKFSELM
jgi:hypothetical protein